MTHSIFYLLVLLLPLNLGKHWIFPFSYVRGSLVDYLIPTFYLTDGLLVLLATKTTPGVEKALATGFRRPLTRCWDLVFLGLFLALSLVSALSSPLPLLAVTKWGRLLLLVLFYVYLRHNFKVSRMFSRLLLVLVLGAVGESLLAIAQWWRQESIFGYLPFGGPVWRAGQYGLAEVAWRGALKVRAYGTFPHPNALAGYLVVVILWFSHWWLSQKQVWLEKRAWFVGGGLALLLLIVGLGLTFSRSGWLALLLGWWWLAWGWILAKRKRILAWLWPMFLALLLFFSGRYWLTQKSSLSWQRRDQLVASSVRMLRDHPLWGVGTGLFTLKSEAYGQSRWPRWLQPVHNVFLLVAVENGLPAGLALISLLIFLAIKLGRRRGALFWPLSGALLVLIGLGLGDHYWLTLPQTSLLFWLTLGLIAAYTKEAIL